MQISCTCFQASPQKVFCSFFKSSIFNHSLKVYGKVVNFDNFQLKGANCFQFWHLISTYFHYWHPSKSVVFFMYFSRLVSFFSACLLFYYNYVLFSINVFISKHLLFCRVVVFDVVCDWLTQFSPVCPLMPIMLFVVFGDFFNKSDPNVTVFE